MAARPKRVSGFLVKRVPTPAPGLRMLQGIVWEEGDEGKEKKRKRGMNKRH